MQQAAVSIRQLRLRGERATLAHARAPLLDALDRAPWPVIAPDEIIILRRVHVKGDVTTVLQGCLESVRQQVRAAVDGWTDQADQASAVRFATWADRQACLVCDLLAGRAHRRWFWREGSVLSAQPQAVALGALLIGAPLQLPTVLARVAATPWWPRLWRSLDDSAAGNVLAQVSRATDWRLQSATTARTRALPPALMATAQRFRIRVGALPRSTEDAIARLAAVYLAWSHQPAAMMHGDASIAELMAVLTATAASTANCEPAAPHHSNTASASTEAPTDEPSTNPAQAFAISTADIENAMVEVEDAGTQAFDTRAGGVFLLLNYLALPTVSVQLRTQLAEVRSGWHWLARLALALGTVLDEPLRQFLRQQLSLPPDSDLAALASLPDEMQWAQGFQRRYEALVNRIEDVFNRRAHVRYNRSHVDVHFRADDVELDIRRAGLDVDPGWLPWLGCVVKFYYGGPRAPRGVSE